MVVAIDSESALLWQRRDEVLSRFEGKAEEFHTLNAVGDTVTDLSCGNCSCHPSGTFTAFSCMHSVVCLCPGVWWLVRA